MSAYNLDISPLKKTRPERIYDYSISNRGGRQASDYLDKLKKLFWELTEQPKIGVEREELLPDMRSFSIDSHVVFYRLQQSQVEVVRVLHSRRIPGATSNNCSRQKQVTDLS